MERGPSGETPEEEDLLGHHHVSLDIEVTNDRLCLSADFATAQIYVCYMRFHFRSALRSSSESLVTKTINIYTYIYIHIY